MVCAEIEILGSALTVTAAPKLDSMPAFQKDVEMLCDQLTNEHGGPACVGASMGGSAALAASLTANMSALVLVVGDCSM